MRAEGVRLQCMTVRRKNGSPGKTCSRAAMASLQREGGMARLAETHRELVEIEKQVRQATAKHNAFLLELGLPSLPGAG